MPSSHKNPPGPLRSSCYQDRFLSAPPLGSGKKGNRTSRPAADRGDSSRKRKQPARSGAHSSPSPPLTKDEEQRHSVLQVVEAIAINSPGPRGFPSRPSRPTMAIYPRRKMKSFGSRLKEGICYKKEFSSPRFVVDIKNFQASSKWNTSSVTALMLKTLRNNFVSLTLMIKSE
ncbi:hypothetical protein GWK47_030682 [Chionoecetes opilio]|uniref:Uncharacterized protein n=1 Tax=Chionoecetes opilio TaxID=41210 RepID=A0A8J4YVK4_CHIOP|nr:hypothetical protein GWK47_030682 [Chionoecetes opilio]